LGSSFQLKEILLVSLFPIYVSENILKVGDVKPSFFKLSAIQAEMKKLRSILGHCKFTSAITSVGSDAHSRIVIASKRGQASQTIDYLWNVFQMTFLLTSSFSVEFEGGEEILRDYDLCGTVVGLFRHSIDNGVYFLTAVHMMRSLSSKEKQGKKTVRIVDSLFLCEVVDSYDDLTLCRICSDTEIPANITNRVTHIAGKR
jgi:hypothetical protein